MRYRRMVGYIVFMRLLLLTVFIFARDNSAYDVYSKEYSSHERVFSTPGPTNIHRLLWAFQTGSEVISSPIVKNKRLYVGCNDGNVYCLDSKDGKLIWKYHTQGAISSTPEVSSNKIFILSCDSNFYALDSNNGKLVWKFKTGGEISYGCIFYTYNFYDIYLSSPVLYSGKVYFGSSDGYLYCLNEETGKSIWRYSTIQRGINANFSIYIKPLIFGGMVFFGNSFGTFYALNAKNGKLVWKYDTYSMINTIPVIYNERVIFGGLDYRIHSLDVINGNPIWEVQLGRGWVSSSPVIMDGIMYACVADPKAVLAVDAENGKIIWKKYFTFEYIFSSPALCGDLIYFGTLEGSGGKSGSGNLYALDKKTGKIRFGFRADGHILSSPYIDSGVIYFGTTKGTIYALE